LDDEHLFVAGRLISASLSDLVLSGPMPLEQALALAQQIASALTYIHSQGLVHASISPANCYLGEA
jgi:serine/threonine-protein kinase